MTAFKLIVGLMTNSLGILSEAAHSGLDLVAALVTFLAIRVSDRPPDRQHQFGHGKVENLSALFETLLLLVTCVWIFYEAVSRLLFKEVVVEASLWAFLIMAVSIVIDFSRSRVLYRAARKHNSQALEADALHFSTDIWSSSVVLVGLGLVALADWLPQYRTWLLRADAVAALAVACIVVWVSIRLGKRTVDALLDKAPEGLEERVRAAIIQVEHVEECSRLRRRAGGPVLFVEATVRINPDASAGMAHEIATQVEEAVQTVHPQSDMTVHIEPTEAEDGDLAAHVRDLAFRAGLAVHDVRVHHLASGHHVDLDLEVPGQLSLEKAHQVATQFEETLQARLDNLAGVKTHIEEEYIQVEVPQYVSAGAVYSQPVVMPISVPRTVVVEHEHVPRGELAVHRGAKVRATDGHIGRVDEFRVDDEDRITHRILREGHLWGRKEGKIPLSEVDCVEQDEVCLKLSKAEVEPLVIEP